MRTLIGIIAALALSAAAASHAAPADDASPVSLGLIEGLSGSFANAGAAIRANLQLGIAAINAQGGVRLADGRMHPLELVTWDSQGSPEKALAGLSELADRGVNIILQGNSSAVADALVAAIERRNQRAPQAGLLFLNYSADDPALTNQHCSFWHFRFDADVDMRMNALTDVIARDAEVHRVFLINQDYVFGHEVAQSARRFLAAKRADIEIAGEIFHPIGRIQDFTPYIERIAASHADAVVTGNWGTDLSLLVKAAHASGLAVRFYTFYGDSLGAPEEIGQAGVERVFAVSEWNPNANPAALAEARRYRAHFASARDSYQFWRVTVLLDMLRDALDEAGTRNARALAVALEHGQFHNQFFAARMRASDHQIEEPLVVSRMTRADAAGHQIDQEGSGFAFLPVLSLSATESALPSTCNMQR